MNASLSYLIRIVHSSFYFQYFSINTKKINQNNHQPPALIQHFFSMHHQIDNDTDTETDTETDTDHNNNNSHRSDPL